MAIAGSALNITASFVVPQNSNLDTLIADWRIVDEAGTTYNSGISSSYTTTTTPRGLKLVFTDSTTLPSDMDEGQYSVEWTIVLDTGQFSNTRQLDVEALRPDYLGAEDAVELVGDVTLYATIPTSVATVDVYGGNALLFSLASTSTSTNSEGYEHSVTFDSTMQSLLPSLTPYTLVWKFVDGRNQNMPGSFWLVTPVIVSAIDELRQFLNRVHQQSRLPELDYDAVDLVRWLKMGQDYFNGSGLYTTFSLTNPQGAIYHWWMMCSIVMALQNQYLVEGLRSFSFSGQQVTLDIDVTQYIASIKDDLKGRIDNELKGFKTQLKTYGLTGGDGNMSGKFQVGALGLTLNPASNLGYSGQGYRQWMRVR